MGNPDDTTPISTSACLNGHPMPREARYCAWCAAPVSATSTAGSAIQIPKAAFPSGRPPPPYAPSRSESRMHHTALKVTLLVIIAGVCLLVGTIVVLLGDRSTSDDDGARRIPSAGASTTTGGEGPVPAMFDSYATADEVYSSILNDFCTEVTMDPVQSADSFFLRCKGSNTEFEIQFNVYADSAAFARSGPDPSLDSIYQPCVRDIWVIGPSWVALGQTSTDVAGLLQSSGGTVTVLCDQSPR